MPAFPRYRQRIVDSDDGDCFAACVAMLLHLPQDEVPNFCAISGDWWAAFQAWLVQFGIAAIEVKLAPRVLCPLAEGTLCILSGKSPNIPGGLHSVVAVFEQGEFQYVADPNPSDKFLEGMPTDALFFVPLSRTGR